MIGACIGIGIGIAIDLAIAFILCVSISGLFYCALDIVLISCVF